MESDVGVFFKRNTADRCPRVVDGRDRADAFPCKGNSTVADSAALNGAEVVGRNGRRIALGNADFDAIIHADVYNLGAAFIAACNTARIAVGGIYRVVVSVRPCIVDAARNRAVLPIASPIAARNTACKLVIGAHTCPINQRHVGNIGIVCTGCAACVVLGGRDGACHIAALNAGCCGVARVVAARNAACIAFCRNVDLQGCAAQCDVAAVYACNAARALVCLHRNGARIIGNIYARIRQVQARHAADDVPAAHGDACCRGRVCDRPAVDADDAAKVGIAVLLGAQCGVGRAVVDAAIIPTGDAARRALVGDNAVVGAALQLCVLGHTADDAARHRAAGIFTASISVIVKAVVIALQADTAAEDAGLAPHFQAADRCRVAVAAVCCVADGQAGCCIVIADNAAHIGVDLQIKLVGRVVEGHLFVTARQCIVDRHKAGIRRHGGQNCCQIVRDRCQQAVIADDAARQTVGLDAARLCGGCKSAGRAAGCGGFFDGKRRSVRANHRHISADDTAHAKRAADFRHLYIGRRQGRGKVQADHTADRLAAHDLAADGQQRGAGICNFRRCIIAADQTADKIAAADDRADLHRGCILVPCKHGIFAVAADQTAHIVRAGGRFLIVCFFIGAQRLQQGAAAAVGGGVRGHAADAVFDSGSRILYIRVGAAPVGIVQARNTAHIGRIFAKARHKAAVGNAADRALAAVDRHNTAHIAVAQHGAAVAAAGCFKLAAAEAARHAADKAAAQHIALLRGAIIQRTPAGKAHQTADKITLERAVIGECAIVSIPALYGGFQLCFGHIAAGGAGAAAQRDIFAVARNAAEELAQHAAVLTLGAAKVVGAHADRTLVLKAGQGVSYIAAVIKVAHNAARKGAADDGGLVGYGFSVGVWLKRQVGGIHCADHTAHANAAPDRVYPVGSGCGVACLFCKGIVRSFQALVLQQTGYRHIGVHRQRGNCLRLAVFGYGNAHEAANAARLVCIIVCAIFICFWCAG